MDDKLLIKIKEDLKEENDSWAISTSIYQYKQIPNSDTNRIPEIREKNLWNIYKQAIYKYMRRDIGSDADAVAAFAGMARLICHVANIKFWYDIPAFAF